MTAERKTLSPDVQSAKPMVSALPDLRASGATSGLRWLALLIFIALTHVAYHQLFSRMVIENAESYTERHERLHDYGGLLLIAWQIPLSAIVLYLIYRELRNHAPGRLLRRLFAAAPGKWMCSFVCLTTAFGILWSGVVLGGQSSVEDDDTYLFQAALIAQGQLDLPFPWPEFPQSFQWSWMADAPDRYYSFQMPGHCIVLAIGVLLRAPWMMTLFATTVMCIFTHLTARRMYGRRTAILTTILLATSPYLLVTQSTYSAAVTGAACVAIVFWAGTRLLDRSTAFDAIYTGLAIGLLWFVRPPTAAFVAIPFGLIMLREILQRKAKAAHLAIVVITSIVALLPYFIYCRAISDPPHWTLSPGDTYSERLASPEISLKNITSNEGHERIKSIPNAIISLVRLNTYLFGWPLSLIPIGFLLVQRKWYGHNAWLLASCFILLGFYCLSEKILGWYYYELMPCAAILGARATIEFRKWLSMRGCGRIRARRTVSAIIASACLASLLISVPLTMARQWHFVWDWSEPINWLNTQIPEGEALVLIDFEQTDAQARTALLGDNDPFLKNRIVCAKSMGNHAIDANVRNKFPNRATYKYRCNPKSGEHTLTLWNVQ